MKEFRFNVFGTLVAITGSAGSWQAFHLGTEGKRRPADFIVPGDIAEHELLEYLADLFHEHATPNHGTVEQIWPGSGAGGRSTALIDREP